VLLSVTAASHIAASLRWAAGAFAVIPRLKQPWVVVYRTGCGTADLRGKGGPLSLLSLRSRLPSLVEFWDDLYVGEQRN
jgi:hypothetical protein